MQSINQPTNKSVSQSMNFYGATIVMRKASTGGTQMTTLQLNLSFVILKCCTGASGCDPEDSYDCKKDGTECIALSKHCDGHRDCGNGEDELDASCSNISSVFLISLFFMILLIIIKLNIIIYYFCKANT